MNINPQAKRILCYGDSNTWGWVPASMGKDRFSVDKRWTGRLQKLLGADFEIIEEGLGGRTTMFVDPRPEYPNRNGLDSLGIILETHLTLDLVILMLGTTDTKEMMNLSVQEIGEGMSNLVKAVKGSKLLNNQRTPSILVVVPPVVNEEAEFAAKLFKGGTAKGMGLIDIYQEVTTAEKVYYLNPLNNIEVDTNEGVHLDENNHSILAELIFKKIQEINL